MKPLYIVGTQRDVGKTTLSIGLVHALRKRGLRVAYTKPLGQRLSNVKGQTLHDDAMVLASLLDNGDTRQTEMAVPLPRGRVEKEVHDLHSKELMDKVKGACSALADDHDALIVEGMGHVAMGSCLGLSAADIARGIGARAMLVAGGGIGRTIDDISLCGTFLTARGADLMGAIVNKVWPSKFIRIREATSTGLMNFGIKSYGTVPYEEQLACPTMRQVSEVVGGEIISGADQLDNRVENAIVAAMEASHMVSYLKRSTLVISPGDRSDNILACLSAHVLGDVAKPAISGLILTGGFRPDGTVMRLISDSRLPVLLVDDDTYGAASKFHSTVFKITPGDRTKMEAAICLIAEYVDIDGLIRALE